MKNYKGREIELDLVSEKHAQLFNASEHVISLRKEKTKALNSLGFVLVETSQGH